MHAVAGFYIIIQQLHSSKIYYLMHAMAGLYIVIQQLHSSKIYYLIKAVTVFTS